MKPCDCRVMLWKALSRRLEQVANPGAIVPAPLLGEYRDQMADNPQALMDLARPVPYSANGGFAGFRLFPGNKPALFARMGLQPGDLVKEVNGVVMDNPMRGAEVDAASARKQSARSAYRAGWSGDHPGGRYSMSASSITRRLQR